MDRRRKSPSGEAGGVSDACGFLQDVRHGCPYSRRIHNAAPVFKPRIEAVE